jgi:hypothetical protein
VFQNILDYTLVTHHSIGFGFVGSGAEQAIVDVILL